MSVAWAVMYRAMYITVESNVIITCRERAVHSTPAYLASVHDERAVLNDRFVSRFSGDEHKICWRLEGLHEDP